MKLYFHHVFSMIGRCEDRTETHVNYVEFLEQLKVDVRPGDLNGLSTQIYAGSHERERRRQEDLHYRWVQLRVCVKSVFLYTCNSNEIFNILLTLYKDLF